MAEISKIQPFGSSTQYDLNALKIKINDTAAPSSATTYRIICCNANSGYAETNTTSSFGLYRNSTSNFAVIGNSTIQGGVTLHKGNGKYADLVPGSLTANRTITFPDASGTVCLTNGTGASGTWGISISGNAATASTCSSANLTDMAFTWASSYSTGSWMLIYNGEDGANGGKLFRGINQANTAAWVRGGASGTWEITSRYTLNVIPYSGNECTLGGQNASSTNTDVYINYRSCAGGSTSDGAATLTAYRFCNRKGSANASIYAGKVYGAVWNDIAETRNCKIKEPGIIVIESNDGEMRKCTKRRHAGAKVISDTFGYCMGQITDTMQPIAIAGRVLVNIDTNKEKFKLGMPVCSGPNGGIVPMKWYEKILWPECIVGFVSEIPNYDTWYGGSLEEDGKLKPYEGDPISVNNRIWIYVK